MGCRVCRLLGVVAVFMLGSGCATARLQAQGPHSAPRASSGPQPAGTTWADDDGDDGDEQAPGHATALLDTAFLALRDQHPQIASDAFVQALGSHELNDAGRALCYWHICACQMALGHLDAGRNALADFVSVAQELLHAGRAEQAAQADFIARFELAARLEQARALMSSAWAGKTQSFGRSPKTPVRVHSTAEMLAFLAMVPACQTAQDRKFLPGMRVDEGLPQKSALRVDGHLISRVDVACRDADSPRISFYFERVEEPATTLAEDDAPSR